MAVKIIAALARESFASYAIIDSVAEKAMNFNLMDERSVLRGDKNEPAFC